MDIVKNKRTNNVPLDQFPGLVDSPKKSKEDKNVNTAHKSELEDGEISNDRGLPQSLTAVSQTTGFSDDFSRKRKVALLLSYCGANYHGMQKNPNVETIEKKLLEALCDIQAIRPEHKNEFLVNNNNQLSFQRAARTDKARETFLEDVNKLLPDDIRVFGMERVTKSFDAKCSCSSRTYEYLVPTIAFAPSKDIFISSYRISEEQQKKVNRLLATFEGTHNFHNYTSGKNFSDKSAHRYITCFKMCEPFECGNHEFVSIEIAGQSFMIHQIRKMIGIITAICRGHCGEDVLERSWKSDKTDIPKAPGLGLLLNKVFYTQYNKKHCNDGLHQPIDWTKQELEVERFKIAHIWNSIIQEEIKTASLSSWLKTLVNHSYTSAGMKAPMPVRYKGQDGVFPK